MERSFEREIIPMARSEGLALAPWNVLAAGKLRTDAEEQRRRETGEKGRTILDSNWERTEDEVKMSRALEKVAAEVGARSITSGKCLIFNCHYLILIKNVRHSCHCVSSPQNPLRLPYCRWSQGRTSSR